jgi:predicted flap endonuclease-1-like 5' DNA nuclease
MFLIDAAHRVPPLPVTIDADPVRQISTLTGELRELRAHNDRLRLTVRLREDRIRELEQTAREQRARADALEARLAQLALASEEPQGDDLKRIPGIGPSFERALHDAGVTTFQQIADWAPQDVERIARQLRTAPARIVRGRWIERARALVGTKAPVSEGGPVTAATSSAELAAAEPPHPEPTIAEATSDEASGAEPTDEASSVKATGAEPTAAAAASD